MEKNNIKIIFENKKAKYDYHLFEKIEAGIVLNGTEIKSVREQKINFSDSFVEYEGNELWITNSYIAEYDKGNSNNHEPKRKRKILLNKNEILKLAKKIEKDGFTIIPTKLYFKNRFLKIEISIAKGKKTHDKREDIKTKEWNRDKEKLMKYKNR